MTSTSLAAVPDATESYPLASLNDEPPRKDKMPPTPRAGAPAAAGDDLALGDEVDVPGNMRGTVRFVGTVEGKKGTFAGVELDPDFAARGKNNGDVDGYVCPWFCLFCAALTTSSHTNTPFAVCLISPQISPAPVSSSR